VNTISPPRFSAFVPGVIHNPSNGSHGHWSQRHHWARVWRDRTLVAILHVRAIGRMGVDGFGPDYNPRRPKHITLLAQVGKRRFDKHDNLRSALKPVVDGLVRARVIHDDGDGCGHVFEYLQIFNKNAERGVRITVAEQEGGVSQ